MGTRDVSAEAEGKGNAAEINIGFYASVVRYKARLLSPAFLISVPILDNKFLSSESKEGKNTFEWIIFGSPYSTSF